MKPMRTYLVNGHISKKISYFEWIRYIANYLRDVKNKQNFKQ